MRSRNTLLKSVSLLLLLLAIFSCELPSSAEEASEILSEGYFGIYNFGNKLGFREWKHNAKESKITVTDNLNQDGPLVRKFEISYGENFAMKENTCTISQGDMEVCIKGMCGLGSVALFRVLDGKAQSETSFPVDKSANWKCIAPQAFAWAKHPTDKPASFSYFSVQGETSPVFTLKAEEKIIMFCDEEVEIVEWTDEKKQVLIQVDKNQNLLKYVLSMPGIKEEVVCEDKETACSQFSNDEARKQPKMREIKVKGDKEGLFCRSLETVGKDEEESDEGSYIKMNGIFSFRAMDGWSCEPADDLKNVFTFGYTKVWQITNNFHSSGALVVGYAEIPDDSKPIEFSDSRGFDSCARRTFDDAIGSLAFNIFKPNGAMNYGYIFWKSLKFPDETAMAFGMSQEGSNCEFSDREYKNYSVFVQNDKFTAFVTGYKDVSVESEVEKDFCSMMGSLRALD